VATADPFFLAALGRRRRTPEGGDGRRRRWPVGGSYERRGGCPPSRPGGALLLKTVFFSLIRVSRLNIIYHHPGHCICISTPDLLKNRLTTAK
jgi:hypothetical protein